jgi:alpha,alpha-trehalose phosphorylase
VIQHPAYPVEPWAIRETELDFDKLAQAESLFALANGHIGLRGNLDEGEPFGLPGTYLAGFYENRPLPYAEAGYGYPDSGQTVVNVTNGKLIRLLVDDEPFDVRYGELHSHERVLDFREGVLRRSAEWSSPTGRTVRVRSTRLVSFTQRAVVAIAYEVEAVGERTPIVVQSELYANEPATTTTADPRAAAVLEAPLVSEYANSLGMRAILGHRTKSSALRMAAAMDHRIERQDEVSTTIEAFDDMARLHATAVLEPGAKFRLVKFVSYGWSSLRSELALRDQVAAALAEACTSGWEGLAAEQREYLDQFWGCADVEIAGDEELQQATRFGLYHVLQAGARSERRAIAAKGLTGPGYDGHTFWDSETFVLPVLTYTSPRAARDALLWRHRTLGAAQEHARQLRLAGAAFPWRTIHGEECSGYWPAGTAAFHINADIADATLRYVHASEDREFERGAGLELLVQTARLWRSLGHHDSTGGFRIDGVTGPDEYSAIADNNVYTNLMAEQNLREAAALAERYPNESAELGVDAEETASWRDAAAAIVIPYDHEREVHAQAERFTDHQLWDFAATTADEYPLLLHFPYFDLYRKQVVKQSDLVLALHLRGDRFTDEEKARDFAYYEALTVRDSSLSACTQSVIAAEVGHLDLAFDYFREAALMDLDDLEHNTRDGVHIASLAGAWLSVVAGFGGMRDHGGELTFKPRLPAALEHIEFRLKYRWRTLVVKVARTHATYTLSAGEPLSVKHFGETVQLHKGKPVERAIPRAPHVEPPRQPLGREPLTRALAPRTTDRSGSSRGNPVHPPRRGR